MENSSSSNEESPPAPQLDTVIELLQQMSSQMSGLDQRLVNIEGQTSQLQDRMMVIEKETTVAKSTDKGVADTPAQDDSQVKLSNSSSPIYNQNTPVLSSASSTPPVVDNSRLLPDDFTRNFGFQTHQRQSLAPDEYRRAHMSVNMKADIPPFDFQLAKFKPYSVLKFIEQLDHYLLRYFKISYSQGTNTDFALLVTQYVHDDFRRQLGMSLPPNVCDTTDDATWYSLPNQRFFKITRAALQPQSEYSYSTTLLGNVYLDNSLNFSNLTVFNFKTPFSSMMKFLHKFGAMHDFLNMPDDYVEGCSTCVPHVNCNTSGAIRVFKTLLSQRCETAVVDGLVGMAHTALQNSNETDAKKRRLSNVPGTSRRRSPPNKFESVEEFLKFIGFVIEDYLQVFKSQLRFVSLMKRRTFHSSNSSSSSTVVQSLDHPPCSQSYDQELSDCDSIESTPTLQYVTTKSQDGLRKVNVCWQFLRNGECSQSKLGRTCPYSHTHTAVVEFANSDLAKMVATINKCISGVENRFALHRHKDTCNARVNGTQQERFQPSHRKFSPSMLPQQKGAGTGESSTALSRMTTGRRDPTGDRPGIIRIHPRPPVTPPTPVLPPVADDEVEVIVLSDSDHLDDIMDQDTASSSESDI